jgi:hypothetical protein
MAMANFEQALRTGQWPMASVLRKNNCSLIILSSDATKSEVLTAQSNKRRLETALLSGNTRSSGNYRLQSQLAFLQCSYSSRVNKNCRYP